jgi:hypothetical protein
MNARKLLYVLIIISFGLFFLNSCAKNADGTVTVIPIAPTVLKATTFSTTAINLTWTDNSTNEDGFKIERKNGVADFSLIATLGADKTVYKDSLLTPYTTYTYRVYSYNSAGKSTLYSNLDSATTNGVPLLTTRAIDSLSYTSAKSGGVITNSGGASVIAKGIVWSTTNNPSIDLATKTNDGVDTGNYKSSMTGLTPGTLYNVWAYATNSKGTAFGNMVSFTTLALALPTISATTAATSITSTAAQGGGIITSDGGAAITARGVCWSTTANPTTANSKTTDGTGLGTFTSSLTGLVAATTYYVRSYATNSVGTVYGAQVNFSTTTNTTVEGYLDLTINGVSKPREIISNLVSKGLGPFCTNPIFLSHGIDIENSNYKFSLNLLHSWLEKTFQPFAAALHQYNYQIVDSSGVIPEANSYCWVVGSNTNENIYPYLVTSYSDIKSTGPFELVQLQLTNIHQITNITKLKTSGSMNFYSVTGSFQSIYHSFISNTDVLTKVSGKYKMFITTSN